MSITKIITEISGWAEEAICSKVRLKLPDPEYEDEAYNEHYIEVMPSVWPLFVPTSDKQPPHIRPTVPSLCVELMEGEDRVQGSKGTAKIRFALTAWNPGEHGQDRFMPDPADPKHMTFTRWSGAEAEAHFLLSYDGWKDVWNFADTTLREVEIRDYIAGYRIIHENGVKFGPFVVDDTVVEDYPYWYCWISFEVEYALNRVREDIKELL